MEKDTKTETKKPAYWRKDVQWIVGIMLSVMLGIFLLSIGMARITEEENAVAITSTAIATLLSGDLDDPTDTNQFMALMRVTGSISPIPDLDVTITADEVEGKTPREIRIALFEKIARPIYQDGEAGLVALSKSPEAAIQLKGQLGALGILTQKNHDFISTVQNALALIVGVLMVLLIIASRRLGRIFAPGLIVALASAPGAALFSLLDRAARANEAAVGHIATEGLWAGIQGILKEIGYLATGPLAQIYQTAFFVGLGLVGISIVGKLLLIFTQKIQSKRNTKKTPATEL